MESYFKGASGHLYIEIQLFRDLVINISKLIDTGFTSLYLLPWFTENK